MGYDFKLLENKSFVFIVPKRDIDQTTMRVCKHTIESKFTIDRCIQGEEFKLLLCSDTALRSTVSNLLYLKYFDKHTLVDFTEALHRFELEQLLRFYRIDIDVFSLPDNYDVCLSVIHNAWCVNKNLSTLPDSIISQFVEEFKTRHPTPPIPDQVIINMYKLALILAIEHINRHAWPKM